MQPTFGSYSSSESSSFHQPDDVGVSDMEQRLGDFVYDSFINISLTSKPVTTSCKSRVWFTPCIAFSFTAKWLILEGTALDEEDESTLFLFHYKYYNVIIGGSFNGATVALKMLPTEVHVLSEYCTGILALHVVYVWTVEF